MTIKGYFILFFYSILSGKKRKPAWTDRILWRIKPKPLPSEEDDEKASTSTDEEQDEYPVLVTQDKYTSDMSYGVSDHKPVIATFSLEVRANALHRPLLFQTFFKNIFLFSYLSRSWEKSLTHHWCACLLWAYGAQARMHFWPTLSWRTLCLLRGTGSACTRY